MARPRTRIPLNVFLNGRLVGTLRKQAGGAIDFQYATAWLSLEKSLPISLSLPLREDRYVGAPVVAVFDNLLPDNDLFRLRLAEQTAAEGVDAYSLLSAVGRDCVGALQFLPDGESPGPAGRVEGQPLTDRKIARILEDLKRFPLGVSPDNEFRISIAGVQEKTALLYWKNRWHLPRGGTPTTHILKPQIGVLENGLDLSRSVENEHLCMSLARALGLPVAKTRVATFEGKRVLVVERFDRRWMDDRRLLRLPQEDCCQALSVPSTRKYEASGGPGVGDILELLKGSDDPETDRGLFLKAQIVFWLFAATDGHAKNFSVRLFQGGRFRLAPLYDILSAQTNVDAGRIQRNKMKLAMSVGAKRHYVVGSILPRHFIQTAEKYGTPRSVVEMIMEELRQKAPGAIGGVLDHLPPGFPETLADSIVGGFRKRVALLGLRT